MNLEFIKKTRSWPGVASILTLLVLWEAAYRLNFINRFLFSSPSVVLSKGWYLFVSGFIWPHLGISILALLVGYLIAIGVGIVLPFLICRNERTFQIFSPYIYVLTFIPMAAIVPLIVIWFGIGLASKVVVIALLASSPILVSTLDGIKNSRRDLIDMAESFGADKDTIFKTVIAQGSLPFIFSGLRLAVSRGMVGLVVSEIFGFGAGLGYLISFYNTTFNPPLMIFIVSLLAVLNFCLISLVSVLENKVVKWRA